MLIRDAVFELLQERGVQRIYGNPGSTELSLLSGLPAGLDYILCLHEHTAVAAAAGEATLTGRPTLVNLHTLPGLANGSGALATASANRSPVVVTAGQQHTGHLQAQPLLSGPMVDLAAPLTKRSFQPIRAADVPLELERAFRLAMSPPRGPVFLALPMDFLEAEALGRVQPMAAPSGFSLPQETLADLGSELRSARSPAIVTGEAVESYGGFDAAVTLADRVGACVYAAPMAARFGFPTGHPRFAGQLLPDAKVIHERLAAHDLVLVTGGPPFVLYPYRDHPVVPNTTRTVLISESPDDVANYRWGTAHLADVGATLRGLVAHVPQVPRGTSAEPAAGTPSVHAAAPEVTPAPTGDGGPGTPHALDVTVVTRVIREALGGDFTLMDESVSNGPRLRAGLPVDRPNRYLRSSNGGLGSALPAAIGAAFADPSVPVVVMIGEGSLLYSPQALWTMAQHRLPILVIVLNNASYRILQDFHRNSYQHLGTMVASELPGIDPMSIAEAFGVRSDRIDSPEHLRTAIDEAVAMGGPVLLDVPLGVASPSMF